MHHERGLETLTLTSHCIRLQFNDNPQHAVGDSTLRSFCRSLSLLSLLPPVMLTAVHRGCLSLAPLNLRSPSVSTVRLSVVPGTRPRSCHEPAAAACSKQKALCLSPSASAYTGITQLQPSCSNHASPCSILLRIVCDCFLLRRIASSVRSLVMPHSATSSASGDEISTTTI
jgi:hypothetical protein